MCCCRVQKENKQYRAAEDLNRKQGVSLRRTRKGKEELSQVEPALSPEPFLDACSWYSSALSAFPGLLKHPWVSTAVIIAVFRPYRIVYDVSPLLPVASLQACLEPLALRTSVLISDVLASIARLTSSLERKQGKRGCL